MTVQNRGRGGGGSVLSIRIAPAALVFALAALILAAGPAAWLVQSWLDPSYDSSGFGVFAAVAGLFLWSVTSPVRPGAGQRRLSVAVTLLGISAGIRLAGQILAVNVVGAICLVLDVCAAARLCRLSDRERAVSPGWLALAFAFSLPVERILQRSLGHLLQEFSAAGACGALSLLYGDLECRGVRLIVDGADVLVDLPCSGARTLLLGLLGFSLTAAAGRPTAWQAAVGAAVTIVASGLSNVLRIALLAVGLAQPERLGGINVMERPWHDLIGLGALALVCLSVAGWAVRCRRRQSGPAGTLPPVDRTAGARPSAPRAGLAAALVSVAIAGIIVNLPRTPLDVSRAPEPIGVPRSLAGTAARPVALSDREMAYFTRFGGLAAKAEYGAMGLLVTRTTSPLRHLHAPEDCLRGLGFDVDYLGASYVPIPTAVYRAVAPDGRSYRVEVSFISDRGTTTYNVATAVWLWLKGDARGWTAVQRIAPEGYDPAARARFTEAVIAALDLPSTAQTPEG